MPYNVALSILHDHMWWDYFLTGERKMIEEELSNAKGSSTELTAIVRKWQERVIFRLD